MQLPNFRTFSLALGAWALLLFGATSAYAHAHLLTASPAANAAVASPATVTLHFSEPLEARFSGFEIADSRRVRMNAPSRMAPQDNSTLVAAPAAPLAPGVYRVTWHIVAHDGHRMRGAFTFTVRPLA